MNGRRFIKWGKNITEHQLKILMVRKPTYKKISLLTAERWKKKLAPLKPLTYKLQKLPTPDTTLNIPLGGTDQIPFFVM